MTKMYLYQAYRHSILLDILYHDIRTTAIDMLDSIPSRRAVGVPMSFAIYIRGSYTPIYHVIYAS
jgi:hypothetical protein